MNVEHKADVTWRQGCSSAGFASGLVRCFQTILRCLGLVSFLFIA